MNLFRKLFSKSRNKPDASVCPAGCRIDEVLRLASRGQNAEALALMKKDLPLPLVCGLDCGYPCMKKLSEAEQEKQKKLLRSVISSELEVGERCVPEIRAPRNYDDRIAIIGGGPTGISCAYYLALLGYRHITIYDRSPAPGGMLAYGIPSLHVNRSLLHTEISALKEMGIVFRCGVEVGSDVTLQQMREEGYRCFYLAVGAQADLPLGIAGKELSGVYGGAALLRGYMLGTAFSLGGKCAVIGGGELALTIARVAGKLGADDVTVLYDRSRGEMTAPEELIRQAEAEGISIRCLTAVREILGNEEGRVRAVITETTELKDMSELTRTRIPVGTGSREETAFDNVIAAMGRKPDIAALDPDNELVYNLDGSVRADPETGRTGREDVFVGGELLTGHCSPLDELCSGRKSAQQIHSYLHP